MKIKSWVEFYIRITPEQAKWLEKTAWKRKISKAELIRVIIDIARKKKWL